MRSFSSLFLLFVFSSAAFATEVPAKAVRLDALLAKVGRESVTYTDLQRFREVDKVLICSGVTKRAGDLPDLIRPLLDAYIEEEFMYLEARSRKITVAGQLQDAVQAIHKTESCKLAWQSLGERFGKLWKTPSRPHEGESRLVRELEKRILVERFRKSEVSVDSELWRREVKARYPVKVYFE